MNLSLENVRLMKKGPFISVNFPPREKEMGHKKEENLIANRGYYHFRDSTTGCPRTPASPAILSGNWNFSHLPLSFPRALPCARSFYFSIVPSRLSCCFSRLCPPSLSLSKGARRISLFASYRAAI